MADAAALARLGIFVQRQFLDAALCASLRETINVASASAAVVVKERTYHVDEKQRRTTLANVTDDVARDFMARLLKVQPQIEQHYRRRLNGCSSPEFLRYSHGDYFRPHADRSEDHRLPSEVQERSVSAITFLNDQSERPGPATYCGGYLNFYNLTEDADWRTCRFQLSGEQGLLVAFPSETVHEVTQITHGERFTVVSWFYSGRRAQAEDRNGNTGKHTLAEERASAI